MPKTIGEVERRETSSLVGPIAVRPFTVRIDIDDSSRRRHSRRGDATPDWGDYVLLFDTETSIDTAQALLFGSYQVCRWEDRRLVCEEQGLFYADELPTEDPAAVACLRDYAKQYDLTLHSRHEFVTRVFFHCLCGLGAIVSGFNLPFDLSRIAVEVGEARGRFYGGFSFILVDYLDAKGRRRADDWYARVCVNSLDSKRAIIGLSGGREPSKGKGVRARFLDLRTLAYALTDRSHSLESACEEFEVEHGKTRPKEHGRVTPEYIAYNRRDVQASRELLERMAAVFDMHPIGLDPCGTRSPASLAKAYLEAMGVNEPAKQFAGFPKRALGDAMCAYYGGRCEAHIRRTIVPVVYTDFLSMYPTVNSLMQLWLLLTADRIEVVDWTAQAQEFLNDVSLDRSFDPSLWHDLLFFGQIHPDDDVLPARAEYSSEMRGWNIGVNPLTCDAPLWYAAPDLVASTLLTGRPPRVCRAFRLMPHGRQSTLRPTRLANKILIDPARDDFFRLLPEERARNGRRNDLPASEQQRLKRFLKVLANSGTYGIFAQINSHDLPKERRAHLAVHGNSTRFDCHTPFSEIPGPFCFPPIASLICAAARLMLALLERCVTDAGGQYALCDTDSMAIVATREGGLVPCPGGPLQTIDGRPAIRALSWTLVDAIVERFAGLSPYDRSAIPGSILKIEDVNRADDGTQRQLWTYAISAKRYVLFWSDESGNLILEPEPSEHGLGHLLDPDGSIDEANKEWIAAVWKELVSQELAQGDRDCIGSIERRFRK
jgi:hypothetical protein